MIPAAASRPQPAPSGRAAVGPAAARAAATGARPLLSLLAAPLLGGCALLGGDEFDPAAEAAPIVIPLPQPATDSEAALLRFYEAVLARMQQAHREGDVGELRTLLATYDRDGAPDWARERLRGFRALEQGLVFEQYVRGHAALEVAAALDDAGGMAVDCLGAPLRCELRLTAPPAGPWHLGGRDDDDPVSFRFAIAARDQFLDGSVRDFGTSEVVRLDRAVDLEREPLLLPLLVDLGSSAAVRRDISLRVELLPGYVRRDQTRAPVQTTVLAQATARQWPAGHDAVRQRPLATLRAAMQLGDPAHFPHVRLAAEFAPVEERREVEALLIDWVRLGRPDQAVVAMAALRAATGAGPAVGDRDGWLAWWQARR